MFTPLLFLIAVATPAAVSAETPGDYYKLLNKARADFAKQDYKTAADEFIVLTRQNPAAGEPWISLGNCYYEMKEPAKAIEPYKRALALGHSAVENVAYNIGCCYALAGDKDNAFLWLEKALALRFEQRPMITRDSDLNGLHDDPRWIKVAGLAPKKEAPREEQWRYDIDFLTGEMRRMHYRWSAEGLPKAVVDGAASLKERVSQLSDAQVLVEMQKLMVMLEDGHSELNPGTSKVQLMRLPLRLFRYEEGLFVIDSENPGLKGGQLLAIGGTPVEEIWSKMGAYVSRDNDQGLNGAGPFHLTFLDILRDAGVKVDEKATALSILGRDGKRQEVVVESKPYAQAGHSAKAMKSFGDPAAAPLYLSKTTDLYWFQDLPDAKAVYFQYNGVVNKPGEPVSAFAEKLNKHLQESSAENLIVDVRWNGGGNSFLNRPLIRAFVAFEMQKKGRIFLITGRNTFSAAQNFTNDVVRMTNATVVGEPSSSKPFFIGESAPFVLPYSRVGGTISTRLHTVNAFDRRVWIAPDIPVPVRAADYFANRDAALEAIVEVIGEAPGT